MTQNNTQNTIFVGCNSTDVDEIFYTRQLVQLLSAMGIINADGPEDLKHLISTVGANDLKVMFKITVEPVEFLGTAQ